MERICFLWLHYLRQSGLRGPDRRSAAAHLCSSRRPSKIRAGSKYKEIEQVFFFKYKSS